MTDPNRQTLIPRDGLLVRRPDVGEYLPAEGAEVVMSVYWLRRIKCGDVHAGKPSKPKADKGA